MSSVPRTDVLPIEDESRERILESSLHLCTPHQHCFRSSRLPLLRERVVSHPAEALKSTLPPVLSTHPTIALLSQNSLAANEVSFLVNEGTMLWFCAGTPTPMNDPYWKTSPPPA